MMPDTTPQPNTEPDKAPRRPREETLQRQEDGLDDHLDKSPKQDANPPLPPPTC